MITKDYVSYGVAKLLKEKGFDEPIQYFYKFDSKELYRGTVFTNTQIGDKFYNAPTLQMAIKWLREVHRKWITITFHWYTVDGETTLYYSPYIMLSEYENVVLEDKNPFKMKLFNSYEEACESAIKYCLEHLI